MTRLEIINAMLASVGEEPVSSIKTQHPSTITAMPVLNRTSRKAQARGWWFNQERGFPLSPNQVGEVLLPSNTLSADPSVYDDAIVQRGNRLYDRYRHTFTIGQVCMADLVLELEIEDLPAQAGDYILAAARYEFYVNEDGDDAKARMYLAERADTWALLQQESLKNTDTNAMDRPNVMQMLYRIRPITGYYLNRNPNLPGGGR